MERGLHGRLSLPGLEALLRLVDDIDAALATHEAVVAMTVTQGFQRITDFHDITKRSSRVGVNPRRIKMNALYASNRRRDQERAAAWVKPTSLAGFPRGRAPDNPAARPANQCTVTGIAEAVSAILRQPVRLSDGDRVTLSVAPERCICKPRESDQRHRPGGRLGDGRADHESLGVGEALGIPIRKEPQ